MQIMQQIVGTGLSGLVGSRIVELLSSKFKFTNFDLSTGIDITNREKIEQKIFYSKSNSIIHLAAFTDVDKAWQEKENKDGLCYKVNVVGTKNVAQACKSSHKYLIHISTDFVFDGKKSVQYNESDKPHPIEWYGQTKLWAEEEVKKSGCKAVILRIAFPYGPKPFAKLDIVHRIIKKLKQKENLNLFYDTVITPTFIDDIAEVVNYCLVNRPTGIYHCVGSSSISPYNLASLVAQKFNFDKTLIKKASLANLKGENLRPRQQYLDISNRKLESDFGIKMLTIEDALEKIRTHFFSNS